MGFSAKNSLISKGDVIASLDIGSSKIACIIARAMDDAGSLEILGLGYRGSRGVENGSIINMQEVETTIRDTVHTAENMAKDKLRGYPLRDVIVNLPGVHASSKMVRANVGIAGHEVTDNDVRRALSKAQNQVFDREGELIHTIPVLCSIDDTTNIREPRGMYGQNMEVDINLVSGDNSILKNLSKPIENAHLDISAFCVSSYASGLSCLVEDEMDLGCTIIDIGGGVTSFSVFYGGSMVYSDGIAVGGNKITADIAKVLLTSIASAERLKTLYGSAVGASSDEHEMIGIPILGEEDGGKINHIPRSYLVGTIQMGVEDILLNVKSRMDDCGLGSVSGRRAVLTGGMSQLPGIRELAQKILGKQVRLGSPTRLHGLPDIATTPAFSTATGLLVYASERAEEMPAEIDARVDAGSIVQRAINWIKENW